MVIVVTGEGNGLASALPSRSPARRAHTGTHMTTLGFRYGGYQDPASIHTQAARYFGERLRERLGSDLQFELIGSILKLGRNSGDLPLMVESGELTFCYLATIRFVRWVPEFKIFDLPFVVQDRERAHRALAGALGERFREQMDRGSPYKLLGMWDNGFRYVSNRVRPIRTPADCTRLRIRIQQSALVI